MKRSSILVTGGAGYIGSHTAHLLLRQGYDVTVVDNLSRGYRHNVDPQRLRVLDVSDTGGLCRLFAERTIDAVIHFAAYISVGESMQAPEMYFANNFGGSLSLLTAMRRSGVRHLVFSSTAAVYGNPASLPVSEESPYAPVNPYGESKVMVEKLLRWFDRIHGLRSIALRYFNASGAEPEGLLGEEHEPETHLIPLVLRAVVTGKPVTIFGDDYPTADGTCIRDYIHVHDLAQAHILALESLMAGGASNAFNVGTGSGYSVKQVVRAVEEVTGRKVPFVIGPRREGDPPELVADSSKLRRNLNWTPHCSGLREIVSSAWNFEQKRKFQHAG
ncbi:MAG TPA: UDP-glucose 4-epimerase GalE [Bryobacteraceae bacterium]|nr:UDP-glucose 4-epimerase GalE [Bryobacteraceae bacterium]